MSFIGSTKVTRTQQAVDLLKAASGTIEVKVAADGKGGPATVAKPVPPPAAAPAPAPAKPPEAKADIKAPAAGTKAPDIAKPAAVDISDDSATSLYTFTKAEVASRVGVLLIDEKSGTGVTKVLVHRLVSGGLAEASGLPVGATVASVNRIKVTGTQMAIDLIKAAPGKVEVRTVRSEGKAVAGERAAGEKAAESGGATDAASAPAPLVRMKRSAPLKLLFLHGNGACIRGVKPMPHPCLLCRFLSRASTHVPVHGTGGSGMMAENFQMPGLLKAIKGGAKADCPEGFVKLGKKELESNAGLDAEMRKLGLSGDLELFMWYEVMPVQYTDKVSDPGVEGAGIPNALRTLPLPLRLLPLPLTLMAPPLLTPLRAPVSPPSSPSAGSPFSYQVNMPTDPAQYPRARSKMREHVIKQGGYDGIIGFSQGFSLAMDLAEDLEAINAACATKISFIGAWIAGCGDGEG